MKRILVKDFRTFVCGNCGNVARRFYEEKEPCHVCSKLKWRKCVLDERKKDKNMIGGAMQI